MISSSAKLHRQKSKNGSNRSSPLLEVIPLLFGRREFPSTRSYGARVACFRERCSVNSSSNCRLPCPLTASSSNPAKGSEFDVIGLIRQAKSELGTSDPAAYMIFLLAVTAGLRRKEIDLLEWPSFRFKDNVIRIEPTQFFHPKSQDSIGEIQMDPQIMAIFRQYHGKAKGNFVIPSGKPPKTVLPGDYYRCESDFDALNAWLRSKEVNTQKPLHTLR